MQSGRVQTQRAGKVKHTGCVERAKRWSHGAVALDLLSMFVRALPSLAENVTCNDVMNCEWRDDSQKSLVTSLRQVRVYQYKQNTEN